MQKIMTLCHHSDGVLPRVPVRSGVVPYRQQPVTIIRAQQLTLPWLGAEAKMGPAARRKKIPIRCRPDKANPPSGISAGQA